MYRFAPSPTGDMHIGNLRAAIFNYICSLQDKSGFILRIEDTDTARKIRHVALSQLGGREKVRLPIEETIHDHQGLMVQYFRNGAVLRLDKRDGTCLLYTSDAADE